MHEVNQPARRTRRAQQAEQTRQRIIDAATALFADGGYAATTLEQIAARADVAVETVYARFRNKANLLNAILEPAILGNPDATDLLDQPVIADIRRHTDQRLQLALLAGFSRGILERTAPFHRILRTASAVDPAAATLERRDRERRIHVQGAYIDMLLASGPLRADLTRDAATDCYGALANPSTYAFLVAGRGWHPDAYERWLADSLVRLLLPD